MIKTGERLAVLIDADNATASIIRELLAEIAKYGTATVKRAYGDWTTSHLTQWKAHLHELAIQPIQQFRYTVGKNATDSALIIDAMDLLHSGLVDGFCLVSSDSDFTRLATRIRETGLQVYGFGERKTPSPFVAACDKFIHVENLAPPGAKKVSVPATTVAAIDGKDAATQAPVPVINQELKRQLLSAIDACTSVESNIKDDDWVLIGPVGSYLNKANPSFDSRNYGRAKLSDLIKEQPYLEVKRIPVGGNSPHTNIYVRVKKST
jgi:uncharacterized LabA/DUF88 family protein